MSGFIAMQREALDHPLFRGNPDRFYAWFWLVARAAWKPTRFDVGGRTITIDRGQLCCSRSQLADAWGWSGSAVERFLTRLETEQMIGRETGQGRTIITICNYAKYQDANGEAGQATGQATGQRPDSDRTIKEPLNQLTIEEPKGSLCEKPISAARPVSRAVKLPDDFVPALTPAAQRIVDGWPAERLDHELTAFRDHAADKGRTSKDWQAAFRTWIRNAQKWAPNGAMKNAPTSNRPTNSPTANALERARAAGASSPPRYADDPRRRLGGIGPLPEPVRAIGYERG